VFKSGNANLQIGGLLDVTQQNRIPRIAAQGVAPGLIP
jgi:hypothetical protein